MAKIIIDGRECEAPEGISVLEAAERNGIWIPALCFDSRLSSYGACRLCLVELVRKGRSRVTASCTLAVKDGMEVITSSARLERLRKLNMELILSSCPGSPVVREMARRLGVEKSRFEEDDLNDCILCGRCVRACSEISQRNAITFTGRGVDKRVSAPFDEASSDCVLCGACVSVCPTGSRILDLARISGRKPEELRAAFDADLARSSAISRPYAQAVPNVPVINPAACLKLNLDACGVCSDVCEADAIVYDDSDSRKKIDVGSVVVLPGFDEFMGSLKFDFGYSRFDDVVSSIQFERILSASGPFAGHVQRPSDGKPPRRVAFLQCVGSRDISCRNRYCSSVCCMYAIKEAVIAKEHQKDLDVTVFFMDMRAFGKDFDKYYERARDQYGVRFVRARVSDVSRIDSTDLVLKYAGDNAAPCEEPFDMVVLSVGLEPPEGLRDLADRLDIRLDSDGFVWTESRDPLRTSRSGVFVGGAASGPKDIPETVTQASAAAGKASQLLASARNTLTVEQVFPEERDFTGEPARIGVLVCHCGINIGSVVKVKDVVDYALTLPNVAYAEENLYTCSQDTQDQIKELIGEKNLNRLVVASCSPRTHEPLFQQTLREAGVNPHLFEMANIRDQCSWVHMDAPEKATEKAKDLVAMAVAKVSFAQPLTHETIGVTHSALVLGGGVAGMTSALAIAGQGFDVTLVEKENELGGNLRSLSSTFEEPDTGLCCSDMIARVNDNSRITALTGSELLEVDGFVGNFKSVLKTPSGNRELEHGVVVVATGGFEHRPEEYLYGTDERVMTQLELESAFDSDTLGRPGCVAMIQCVGSREPGNMYCSRVCCNTAVKNALRLREAGVERVVVFYRDMRTYGASEHYYQLARDRGVIFVRYDLDSKPRVSNDDGVLSVTAVDPVLGREIQLEPDVLVLSGRIDANPGNAALARLLKVPVNEDGFFLEAHAKLRPVEFATEGVFVAGLAHGPKNVRETMAQAEAAACKACAILARDEYEAEPCIAEVDPALCSACGTCEHVCAYKAVEVKIIDERRGLKAAYVNPALCKGCGTCAATCRSGAIDVKGIRDHQINLAIGAVR